MFFLVFLLEGVTSQSAWTQPASESPASESVSPGQTIKLSCTTSDTGSGVRWYQQRSGQVPRFVQYEGGSRGEGIPDRFTASRSGNIGYLTITNLQAEDEAVYYCARGYKNLFHSDTNQWGSGTKTFPLPPNSMRCSTLQKAVFPGPFLKDFLIDVPSWLSHHILAELRANPAALKNLLYANLPFDSLIECPIMFYRISKSQERQSMITEDI
uniref:Ig-like domain-containing protein n=1 Tax=Podarcis muralis TaxID=64176 RepID=A0A670JUN8_PODMU